VGRSDAERVATRTIDADADAGSGAVRFGAHADVGSNRRAQQHANEVNDGVGDARRGRSLNANNANAGADTFAEHDTGNAYASDQNAAGPPQSIRRGHTAINPCQRRDTDSRCCKSGPQPMRSNQTVAHVALDLLGQSWQL